MTLDRVHDKQHDELENEELAAFMNTRLKEKQQEQTEECPPGHVVHRTKFPLTIDIGKDRSVQVAVTKYDGKLFCSYDDTTMMFKQHEESATAMIGRGEDGTENKLSVKSTDRSVSRLHIFLRYIGSVLVIINMGENNIYISKETNESSAQKDPTTDK